jgi:hypothetical protein
MGLEANCRVRFNEQSADARVHLDASELVVRGGIKLKVPFAQITQLSAEGGELAVGTAAGTIHLELGSAAPKWKDKIENPPSLLSKLGVKTGSAVVFIGVKDDAFMAEVERAQTRVVRKDADIVFVQLDALTALPQIARARDLIQPAGAIWVIYPKGRKDIPESAVMTATKSAGLVDTKVASFSSNLTAIKAVIPVAKRAAR